jgi:hypothetical protein
METLNRVISKTSTGLNLGTPDAAKAQTNTGQDRQKDPDPSRHDRGYDRSGNHRLEWPRLRQAALIWKMSHCFKTNLLIELINLIGCRTAICDNAA